MTTEHSHVSGNPYSLQPGQWAPPRAPLPPHRLAKIANALGVSMPSPAGPNSSSSYLSASFPGASPTISHTDLPWRVTTPSTASTHHVGSFASSSQSKFLLHVIPPLHLLHDFDASDPLEPAPPPNASGYHTQFRRGTLVSLQPSLHAQLNAIAKEYALPSTIGLILYLITTSPQSRQNSPMPYATPNLGNEDAEEPGPRISEEIWKHIWGRVLKAEREESLALSRGQGSSSFGLGLGLDSTGQPNLRPLVTPTRTETPQPQPITYPITPSSTTSSVSDLRSHSKSTPFSSSSLTHSEPDTPDTPHSSDHEILGIGLPGLNSPSIIPILAKVEFDIDRRRATWYEPWLRGRRMTHAKRAESRQSNQSRSQSHAEGDGDEKRVPFDLKLVERMQNASSVPSFTASLSSREESVTAPLSDSTDEAIEEDTTMEESGAGGYAPLSGSTEAIEEGTTMEESGTSGYAPLSDSTDEPIEEGTTMKESGTSGYAPLSDSMDEPFEEGTTMEETGAGGYTPLSDLMDEPIEEGTTMEEGGTGGYAPLSGSTDAIEEGTTMEESGTSGYAPLSDSMDEPIEEGTTMEETGAGGYAPLSDSMDEPIEEGTTIEENGDGGYTPLSDSMDEAVEEDTAMEESGTGGYVSLSDSTDEAIQEDTTMEEGGHGGYTPLPDPTDKEVDENITTCETDICHHDPLADIFGSDADTWAEMRTESQGNQPEVNPNIVELALDVSSIAAMPEQEQVGDEVDDAQEVWDIMRRMSKPTLTLSIPSSPSSQQLSSPPAGSAKKSPPCPLVLAPNDTRNSLVLHTGPSPILSSSSRDDNTNLPYEHASSRGTPVEDETGDDDELSLDMDQEYMRSRSPEEKRGGAVFEDLNLGLDLGDEDEEYDENDPNDQRRSQYLMRAKLDEIERTLAQFSPRHIKTDDLDQDITITHARTKSLLALHAEGTSKLSVDRTRDFQATGNSIDHADTSDKSWPAISYSSITNNSSQSPSSQSHRPSNLSPPPPQLAINGVSTGAPKSFAPPSRSSSPNTLSTETKIRKRDLEPSVYPTPLPPSFRRLSDTATDSPIPLSPDPFGRYPSYLESEAHSTPTYWDPATGQFTSIPVESRPSLSSVDEGSVASTTPSSRFSADSESFSMDAVTAKTSTPLVSVKTFKRLWRRSKSASVSAQQPPTPNRTSFQGFVPPSSSLHDQIGPPPPLQKGLPPVPVTAMPRTPTRPSSPTTPSSEKTSVRKSILKTWKSVSGSTASSSAPSEPRRDTERPVSNETIKPRRPSILDAGIPPTPKLAEQYLPSNHARTGSGIFERRKSVGRSKMGASSNFSTSSQDFALSSRTHSRTSSSLQQTSSPLPPSGSVSPAPPRHSKVDSSFESAQYELVSSSPRLYPNLSYPYQTLDQD
ncbi:hypothetical protein C8R48DRAFT_275865 [Suillus tomentosus]|nr:hypothetical protein C8R48DRAFT_275865 [Suillus tomentosus]